MKKKTGEKEPSIKLSGEDLDLWERFTQGMERLFKAPPVEKAADYSETIIQKAEKRAVSLPLPQAHVTPIFDQEPQLDGRTEARLKRGKITIDGRLDLHGRTQEQAHHLFNNFVMQGYKEEKRCLLVITGKGRSNKNVFEENIYDAPSVGILKQRLPEWAKMSPVQPMILKVQPAALKDGGGGAFYIYLKRKR